MISVPAIDTQSGVECYCTSFYGTGGSIRQSRDKFRVTELVDETLLSDISPQYDSAHRYPLYMLEKSGVDSNHAILEIERAHHLKLRVMGIKDAKAVSQQYAGGDRPARNPPPNLYTRNTRVTLKGFTKRPIGKGFLTGNHFDIVIDDSQSDDLESFERELELIGNFYGLQRFGGGRLVTHLVGKEILKKDFEKAILLLLTFTTKYDSDFTAELRHKMSDPNNFDRILRELPPGMDIERAIITELQNSRNYIAAIRAIPLSIRRLFVQSYQAFIFNKCLSRCIISGEDVIKPKQGDLCFEMESESIFGRVLKFDSTSDRRMVPAIHLAGFTFQGGKGRFERVTSELLSEEGIISKDFYVKEMDELSQQGGFRQTPLFCTNFSYVKNPLTLAFQLPKGSYATTLLREVIKPKDPISCGF
jgi:tRNA pseudouridine13 synthase